MKAESRVSLERLSTFCDICGFFSVLIGTIIISLDLLENNYEHLQVGIYVFATGYASVKISHRLVKILMTER